ncbi:MAG TPA: oligosaccharide flippase family protein [Burkholderiaceae bacterium]|nr:oligosaccharide flippase family protein [Burkholderiaceae bacterium]
MAYAVVANDDLGRRGARAARWLTLAVAARAILAFAVQVYFARLLGPDLYGVFAAAALVILVVSTLADMGLAWAMLQAPRLEPATIRFALTWQLLVGAVIAAALAFAGDEVAALFREPRAAPIIKLMALSVIVYGVSNSGQNLMLRHLNSRSLAGMQLFAYVIGYCGVSIALSLAGMGIWSLVIGVQVNSFLLLLLFAWTLVRRVPGSELRPAFRARHVGALLKTSALSVVTALTNWAASNIERAFIARSLGTAPLGNYSTASNLANVPTNMLISAVTPIFLTLGGRMVEQPERIGTAFQRLFALVLVFAMPAFGTLSVVSDELIGLLYGAQWLEAAPVLRIVLLASPALIVAGIATPVLWNTERQHHESLVQWVMLPLQIGALWYAVRYGLVMAAVTACLALVARSTVFTLIAARATGLSLRRLAAKVALGALLTLLGMSVSWMVSAVLQSRILLLALLLPTLLGILAVLGMLLAVPKILAPDEWALIVALLPGRVRGWIERYLARRLPGLDGEIGGDAGPLSRREQA